MASAAMPSAAKAASTASRFAKSVLTRKSSGAGFCSARASKSASVSPYWVQRRCHSQSGSSAASAGVSAGAAALTVFSHSASPAFSTGSSSRMLTPERRTSAARTSFLGLASGATRSSRRRRRRMAYTVSATKARSRAPSLGLRRKWRDSTASAGYSKASTSASACSVGVIGRAAGFMAGFP
jgi:hypothetical protein